MLAVVAADLDDRIALSAHARAVRVNGHLVDGQASAAQLDHIQDSVDQARVEQVAWQCEP